MSEPRFKIDHYHSTYSPYALYIRCRGGWLWRGKWERIDCFQTRDDAKAMYEKIKDLPEYLD
jgi:hypothetical protein